LTPQNLELAIFQATVMVESQVRFQFICFCGKGIHCHH